MNNKRLPTNTSAPFSCSHWVSCKLYQQSFVYQLLAGCFLSITVPPASAPAWQQFCWVSCSQPGLEGMREVISAFVRGSQS